ncbi:MAG: tRNA pseudouridine(55) synthase TruB [Acidobacteria bacterium]|nr:tRNA pseudouridine(55) synthase TruB [Acidobacteriota bacterium]
MHGLLIIDKPAGMTSHDVVNRVRRTFKTKKVGHTGTLDPFATGVLVALVGKATRLAQFLDKDEKEYEAVVKLGYETDTGDLTGERRRDRETGRQGDLRVANIEAVLTQFRGAIEQVPPMYSAKKVEGKKLYALARKGIEIERKPVKVNIHELELVAGKGSDALDPVLRIRVVCSAGTYIRTLAEDIGRALGTGAHLTELRRTRAGAFSISAAHSPDEIDAAADPGQMLLPMTEAVARFPAMKLNEERVTRTLNGMSTRIQDSGFADGETVRMLGSDGDLVAIGIFDASENSVRPRLVLG